MIISTVNTTSVYTEQLEGSYAKGQVSVQLIDPSTFEDRRRAVVELWSYDTRIATAIVRMEGAPSLAINATAEELTQTTLRHLRKFLGCYIRKAELLKHMRNVFYDFSNCAEGFKMEAIDEPNAIVRTVYRAIAAEESERYTGKTARQLLGLED